MLARITDNVFLDKELTSFTISGDPGCDGYNVESVAVLEAIVRQPADFHLLLGDLVPTGRERWFGQFEDILERTAAAPVYCLPGNHDWPDYPNRLGRANYWIRAKNSLIVILDNSKWEFGAEAVALLRQALDAHAAEVEHLFVAFHVPPPNSFSQNSVTLEEWSKASNLLLPHRDKVRAIFAGHVHAAFRFELDGMPFLVTGGGGARLDPVLNCFFSPNRHHLVRARLAGGVWSFEGEVPPSSEEGGEPAGGGDEAEIRSFLADAFAGECQAVQRYRLFAERARQLGQSGLAKLFLAAADSESLHAANMLLALDGVGDSRRNLVESARREENEWRRDYVQYLEAARKSRVGGRAITAFDCALKAEKVHYGLFKAALAVLDKGEEFPEKRYFTCSRCGFTHEGDAPPAVCPACGTDDKRFVEVIPGSPSLV